MITIIQSYNLEDVERELKRMLEEGSKLPEIRQLALQVSLQDDQVSAIYDFVKANIRYQPDPYQVELFIHPRKMTEFYYQGIGAGDCITGDTPIWIRTQKDDRRLRLIEVRELLPQGTKYGVFNGLEIFTPNGFSPLLSVKQKDPRRTIRILARTDIGLTPEHKVLIRPNFHENGRYCQADLVKKEDLLWYYPPLFSISHQGDKKKLGNYELGWAFGLFFADGYCNLRNTIGKADWCLTNTVTDKLERAKTSLELFYPNYGFDIQTFNSEQEGAITNFGKRKNSLKHLELLYKPKEKWSKRIPTFYRVPFIRAWRQMFYNSFGVKQVPNVILHGDNLLVRGFWDGANAGDGSGNNIVSVSKLSSIGLLALLHKTGQNLGIRKHKDKFALIGEGQLSRQEFWRFDDKVLSVYDICTGNGEFVAGTLGVSNCDDIALFTASLLRSLGYQANIVLLDTEGQGFNHAVTQVTLNENTIMLDASTNKYPLGWEEHYYQKVVI